MPLFLSTAAAAAGLGLAHLVIGRLLRAGIQFGWGWGQDTFAGAITVANNSIDGVLPYAADGGNIYSQSPMHNSTITGNWLQHDGNHYGMIYTVRQDILYMSTYIPDLGVLIF